MNYIKITLVVLSLSLFSCQGQKSGKIEHLDAKLFSKKMQNAKDLQLIDVRTPEEFAGEHIDNATNMDWNSADFEKNVSNLDKSKPVYVYCKSGGRSSSAANKLAELGFNKVYELNGGIMKWNAAGLAKPSTEEIGMTEAEFNQLLVSDKKILIDFYAEWCGPCKKMAPYLAKMSKEMSDKVTIIKIDADKNKTLLEKLKVTGLPTLLLYENEKLIWKNEGFITEQDLIKKL